MSTKTTVLFILTLAILCKIIKNEIVYASPTGAISGICGSETTPCSFENAITNSIEGDEIYLLDGVYILETNVTIQHTLSFYTNDYGTVFITGSINAKQNVLLFTATSGEISFINIIFQNITRNNSKNYTFLFQGNGTVINCLFQNVTPPHISGTNLKIFNSSFVENFINDIGISNLCLVTGTGELSIVNSTFRDNIIFGDILVIHDGVIANCTFENNQCYTGAFTASPILINNPYVIDQSVVISNCGFINNTGNKGGAVECYSCSNIEIDRCNFIGNRGKEGGVFFSRYGTNITLANCNATNNTASKNGGVIFMYYSNVSIISSIFNNNQANYLGGAICSFFGELFIDDISVTNCSSGIKGGAIYWGSLKLTGDPDLTISNSSFESCSAQQGGVIYNNGVMSVTFSSFILNVANTSGGVIHSIGEFDVSFSSFTNTTINSMGFGGVIFTRFFASISYSNFTYNSWWDGTQNYTPGNGSMIYSSSLISLSNCYINSNKGLGYGMIYSKDIVVTSSIFENNNNIAGLIATTNLATISSSSFNNNAADYGATMVTSNCKIESCIFDSNIARQIGGIIFTTDCSVSNSIFTNNVAERFGAIYSGASNSNLFINNCSFISNSVVSVYSYIGGAAVYFKGSTLMITDSIFSENSNEYMKNYDSRSNCTGIVTAINPSSLTILHSNFTNNHQSWACYSSTGGALTIGGPNFYGNFVDDTENLLEFKYNPIQDFQSRDMNTTASIIISYDSIFSGNSIYSGVGSGIYSDYPLSLYNYQFTNNSILCNSSLSDLEASIGGEVSLMQKMYYCSLPGNKTFPCGRTKENPCDLNTILNQLQNGTIISLLPGNYSLHLSFSLHENHLFIIGDEVGTCNVLLSPNIQLYSSSYLYISRVNFVNFGVDGSTLDEKGMIYVDATSQLLLSNNLFQNISTLSTSLILSEGVIEIIDCLFENNFIQNIDGSRLIGGIVSHSSPSPLSISGSQFEKNLMSGSGDCLGLIYVNGSRYSIYQTVISNNNINCGSSFGTVMINSPSDSEIEPSKLITNSLFINNTLTAIPNQFSVQNSYGGGLWIRDYVSSFLASITIFNDTFNNNKAAYGGGIYFEVIDKENDNDLLRCENPFNELTGNVPTDCSSNEKGMRFYQQHSDEVWPSFLFYNSIVFYDWFNNTITNPPSSITVSTPYGGNILHSLTGVTNFPKFNYSQSGNTTENDVINFYLSINGFMNSTIKLIYQSNNLNQFESTEFTLSQNILLSSSCAPNFQIDSSTCALCEEGQYNFDGGESCVSCANSDLSPCLKYPSIGDQSIVSQIITIEAGYWPDDFGTPSYLIPCPLSNSCKPISCFISQTPPEIDCSYCLNSSFNSTAFIFNSTLLSNNQTIDYNCLCEEGYTNRLCSECVCESISDCYYNSGNQCIQCTFIQSFSWWYIIIVGVIGIIVTIVVIILPKTTAFLLMGALVVCLVVGFTGLYSWSFLTLVFLLILLFMIADKGLPPGAVNSILYFLQTTSSLIDISSWPQVIYPIIESFQISNLNFSFASCFWPTVLSNVMVQFIAFYSVLLPILFFSIIIAVTLEIFIGNYPLIIALRSRFDKKLLYLFSFVYKITNKIPSSNLFDNSSNNLISSEDLLKEKPKSGFDKTDISFANEVKDSEGEEGDEGSFLVNEFVTKIDMEKQEKYKKISTRSSSIAIALLTAGYFPVTLMSLHAIPTTNGYMYAYPWIPISSSSYFIFLIISLFALVVYTIGLPIVFTSILIILRKAIARGSKTTAQRFGSLYSNYRKEIFFYHIIYLVKKATIACLVSLFTKQSDDSQIEELLTILSLASFATLHLIIQPFQSRALNWISGLSEMVILVSYSINLLITYGSNEKNNEEWLKWVMTLVNAIVLLLYFLFLLVVKVKLFLHPTKNQPTKLIIDSNDEL